MKRPNPESQAGRLLHLLESANGGKVLLPDILALKISQYNSRIHDLRHKFGFCIESGSVPGHHDHTWFRLQEHPQHTRVSLGTELTPHLFSASERRKDLN